MANLTKFETLKKDFLNSLSPEKYKLLEKISEVSSCITDFIFRHTEEFEYIFDNLDKPLLGRDNLFKEVIELKQLTDDKQFSEKLAYFKMKHFARIVAKDIENKNELPDLTEEYLQTKFLAKLYIELNLDFLKF